MIKRTIVNEDIDEVSSNESVIFKIASKAKDIVSGDIIYDKALNIVENNFELIEEKTVKYSLSCDRVIKSINKKRKRKIKKIEQICMVKVGDIEDVVNSTKIKEVSISGITGGVTSLLGPVSMPLNFAVSTFLYFRAIEEVALYYGYDVLNDPKEVLIASEVFKEVFGSDEKEGIVKVDSLTKNGFITLSKSAKKAKNWDEMVKSNSVNLAYTKMKALSDPSAKEALIKAGKKGFEKSRFKDSFKWMGEKVDKKTFPKLLLGVGVIVNTISDGNQMRNVVSYANDFYKERFINERWKRISKYLFFKYMWVLILCVILILVLLFK